MTVLFPTVCTVYFCTALKYSVDSVGSLYRKYLVGGVRGDALQDPGGASPSPLLLLQGKR